MNHDHPQAKFLREGLSGNDGEPVRLPLIYEHYEEDLNLAHRELLKSYPRSFWKMRERACEDIGEKNHCNIITNASCNHAASAQQWAYLVGKGSLAEFPAYSVSPGVRMHASTSGGKVVPADQMNSHIQEMARSAEDCFPRVCSVSQVRNGETQVSFSAAAGLSGFTFKTADQKPSNPLSVYDVFHPTQMRGGLRGQWIHMNGDSSTRGFALSLFQQLIDVDRYSEEVAGPGSNREMNFTKLDASPSNWLEGLAIGFIDTIVSVVDGEVLHLIHHPHDAPHVAGATSAWEGMKSQPDTSSMLNEAWASLSARAVRITYRQCTRAVHLVNESFMDVVGAENGPNGLVFEFGAADRAFDTDVQEYRASLVRVLSHMQVAAASRKAQQPYLIYSTMVFTHFGNQGSSDLAAFERGVLAEVNSNAPSRSHFRLLERVQTAAMEMVPALANQCQGLGRGPSAYSVHPFHPVHLLNLWDVQRFSNMLLESQGDRESCDTDVGAINIGYGGISGCCAEQIVFSDLGFMPNDGVAYWANMCVINEIGEERPIPKFSPFMGPPRLRRLET